MKILITIGILIIHLIIQMFNLNNVAFDSTDNSWKLTKYENLLEISSAGFNDGGFGSIKLNDTELLPNTFYWGIATAIIDSVTLEPSDLKYFVYSEELHNRFITDQLY